MAIKTSSFSFLDQTRVNISVAPGARGVTLRPLPNEKPEDIFPGWIKTWPDSCSCLIDAGVITDVDTSLVHPVRTEEMEIANGQVVALFYVYKFSKRLTLAPFTVHNNKK